ncbi:efflux RND transporter periplasmic adaptor subunit [Gimesia panareensis]|uniref:efflux RND transporter periplasmic adaptor subunit n=1 Tax=Gimesia panareensis TaxID=2527978 RepID=UPI0011885F91|nr:efflux RND transporter periplasmic adaptor subunit [Gimesia panareensis]QDU51740.1 Cation efflux system protein CusB precursor [Gimesia panareensis]
MTSSSTNEPLKNSEQTPPHPEGKSARWWLRKLLPTALFLAVGLLLIVLVGVAQRIGWIQSGTSPAATSTEGGKETIYTCPMHPQIRQPKPGRCPICGMKLVPAAKTGASLNEMSITIEPAQRRLANIQTAVAKLQPVHSTIETIGSIEIDESRQATIAAYIDGRIEKLFADYTGIEVEKGDHLAIVYSPELYSAQVELLEARNALKKMTSGALAVVRETQEKLVENSRQKLVELGMSDEQIEELISTGKAQSRLTIFAPMGGTVTEKLAEEGKYIKAGEPIYRIANLTTVWLMLELYPEDAARIRFGQQVDAELQSLPGKTLKGRVVFIDPTVNPQRRTVGVRVEFKNEQGQLRPGDYAKAQITVPIGPQGTVYDAELAGKWISPMHPQVIRDQPGKCPICGMNLVPTSRYGFSDHPIAQRKALTVPRSAVLMAGDQSVVYVETEPGRFELRNVKLGPLLGETAVILEGVKAGEKVATSGNFLIDSQMQLSGKPSLIDPHKFKPAKKTEPKKGPLKFDSIRIEKLSGENGQLLEKLYAAYFAIQKQFAADKKISESQATTLQKLASQLAQDSGLSPTVKQELQQIADNAAHLHHLSIKEARQKFKPISHAVVTLATQVRGGEAKQSFQHFYCPMVPQGGGDWLQPDLKLVNPYFGSQMLSCGELVETFAPVEKAVGKVKEPSSEKVKPNSKPTSGQGEK